MASTVAFLQSVLLTQIQGLQNRLIAFFRFPLEVIEKLAAACHQAEKSAAGGKVLGVLIHVLGQVLDPLGHESNLEVSASGVIVTLLEVSKVDSVVVHGLVNRDGSSGLIAAKSSFAGRR